MAQTEAQKIAAARELARRLYTIATAVTNHDDLKAAIDSIDATMDALPGALNAAQTVKTNFIQRLPANFKNSSTQQEKAIALMVWAMQEVGLL